jgi:hypothetical protein
MKGQGVLPADGTSAAAEKVDFGVSRWQLDKKNFIPGFVTSRCRFAEQRRPVSALAYVMLPDPSRAMFPAP